MRSRTAFSARALAAALLAYVTVALTPLPAVAAGPYPPTPPCALTIDSASPAAGRSLTVTGSGLGADLDVLLKLLPAKILLGGAHTDAAGSFVAVVAIPTSPGPGAELLVASSTSTSCWLPAPAFGGGQSTSAGPSSGTAPSGPTLAPPPVGSGPAERGTISTRPRPTNATSPSPAPHSSAFGAEAPSRGPSSVAGPIALTLALIALLILGGTWLMLALTGRPRR